MLILDTNHLDALMYAHERRNLMSQNDNVQGGSEAKTMSQVRTLHQQAMQHLDEANVARLRGDQEQARQFTRQAYEREKQAAERLAGTPQNEPTHAILYRSAALFALDCGENGEAERLLAAGLSGNPPVALAEQLRALQTQIASPLVPAS